mgnify:CR=1 FL=1|jgi:hypothetical protein
MVIFKLSERSGEFGFSGRCVADVVFARFLQLSSTKSL